MKRVSLDPAYLYIYIVLLVMIVLFILPRKFPSRLYLRTDWGLTANLVRS